MIGRGRGKKKKAPGGGKMGFIAKKRVGSKISEAEARVQKGPRAPRRRSPLLRFPFFPPAALADRGGQTLARARSLDRRRVRARQPGGARRPRAGGGLLGGGAEGGTARSSEQPSPITPRARPSRAAVRPVQRSRPAR